MHNDVVPVILFINFELKLKINLKIARIIEKHKALKAKKELERKQFTCPYCSKKYKSKAYIGAQQHLLECAKNNKGQLKLKAYFKKC